MKIQLVDARYNRKLVDKDNNILLERTKCPDYIFYYLPLIVIGTGIAWEGIEIYWFIWKLSIKFPG